MTRQIPHIVTIACDHLDPSPVVERFDTEAEALDWLGDEIERRVNFEVQHSPYSLSDSDVDAIREQITELARIEQA